MSLDASVLDTAVVDGFDMTLREYFRELVIRLWVEGESFSGKRPLGDSGWECDVYKALIKAGAVDGTLDEDGYVEDCDSRKVDKLVTELLRNHF